MCLAVAVVSFLVGVAGTVATVAVLAWVSHHSGG